MSEMEQCAQWFLNKDEKNQQTERSSSCSHVSIRQWFHRVGRLESTNELRQSTQGSPFLLHALIKPGAL